MKFKIRTLFPIIIFIKFRDKENILRYLTFFKTARVDAKKRTPRVIGALLLLVFTFIVLTSSGATIFSYLILRILSIALLIRFAHEKGFEFPERTILLLICAFLFIQLITSLTSSDIRQSITVTKIRLFYYTFFFASVLLIRTLNSLRAVIVSLVIYTSIVSSVELFLFFSDISAHQIQPAQSRIGFFLHPVTSGEIKMLVIFLIIPFFLIKERYPLPKMWLAVLLTPIFVSFLFTYARGAFIALFTGIIMMGALKNRKVIYAAIIFLVFYFYVLPESVNGRIATLENPTDRSVRARQFMFETGEQMARDNFLLGVGSINLKETYEKYRKATIWGEGEQLHNNLLQLFVTTGIFGLLIWLALIIYIFKRQVIIYRETKGNEILNSFALISVVSFAGFQICGLTDWNFADYSAVVLFWLFASFAFIAERFLAAGKGNAAHEFSLSA